MAHSYRFILRICVLLIFIPLLVVFTHINLPSSNHFSEGNGLSTNTSSNSSQRFTTHDILDISRWRHILYGDCGNQTLCKVPSEYQSITNAYCCSKNRSDCSNLPCSMIYLSEKFIQNVQCLRGGKVAVGVEPDWTCRISPALQLLTNPQTKPSILSEAYTKITAELYGQALAPYRDQTAKWGLRLEGESIGNYPFVVKQKRLLSLFDLTLGYDRDIFDLVNDKYLGDYVDQIVNNSNQRLSMEQVMKDKVKDHAPILWMNSNCDTLSNRTGYMLELMRYIRVDVRGKCGNPHWNQTAISSNPTVLAKEKTKIVKEYLFTVSIENSLEHDYVTEKLWQPLAAGSVPLYLGAPNVDDWLPCSNDSCIVNLSQFSSPREAAKFLNELVENRERYLEYHRWRSEGQVRTSFTKLVNYLTEANQYSMECLLCDMYNRNDRGETRRKLLAAPNPFNDTFPSLF